MPLRIASIDARAQAVKLFFPGDEADSINLTAPDVCSDLTRRAATSAEVFITVRGTAKTGVQSWHPETVNGKNYEVLDGSTGPVPPALQADFRRALAERK